MSDDTQSPYDGTYFDEWDEILPSAESVIASIQALPIKNVEAQNFDLVVEGYMNRFEDKTLVDDDLPPAGLRLSLLEFLSTFNPDDILSYTVNAYESMPDRSKELGSYTHKGVHYLPDIHLDENQSYAARAGFRPLSELLGHATNQADAKRAIHSGDDTIVEFPNLAQNQEQKMLEFSMFCRTLIEVADHIQTPSQKTPNAIRLMQEIKNDATEMMTTALHASNAPHNLDLEENRTMADSRIDAIKQAVLSAVPSTSLPPKG